MERFVKVVVLMQSVLAVDALRMINLDAPPVALQGDTIQLSCSYSLLTSASELSTSSQPQVNKLIDRKRSIIEPAAARGVAQWELMYAIKWYKDSREFFRFLAQDWPHKQSFPMLGLDIDLDKSDNQSVVLRNVSLKTSGSFRCEVSTDAPSFLTKSIERKVFVYTLPSEGPSIEKQPGGNRAYYLGEQLNFNCTSRDSKPPAQIDWIINDKLNLTAPTKLAVTPSSSFFFQVATRRTISLPVAHNKRHGSSTIATYELDDSGWPPVARSLDDNSTSLALTDELSLNQLVETTSSRLQLNVDTDLLQYLSQLDAATTLKPPPPADGSRWSTRRANNNRTSRGDSMRGVGGVYRAGTQSAAPSFGPLRVRCVARVLHLKMSDDVRVKVVNRKRENVIQQELAGDAAGAPRSKSFVSAVVRNSATTTTNSIIRLDVQLLGFTIALQLLSSYLLISSPSVEQVSKVFD